MNSMKTEIGFYIDFRKESEKMIVSVFDILRQNDFKWSGDKEPVHRDSFAWQTLAALYINENKLGNKMVSYVQKVDEDFLEEEIKNGEKIQSATSYVVMHNLKQLDII